MNLNFLGKSTQSSTDVDGAAQQGSPLDGPAHDAEEVPGGLGQVVHFRHAPCEVLRLSAIAPLTRHLKDHDNNDTSDRMKYKY